MRKSLCFLLLQFISCSTFLLCINGAPQVPCYFIFGDSFVDNGNNNDLPTSAKVNYLPYGSDFPAGPTGRFYNGKTPADLVTERLGFENYYIPPFAKASESDILKGLNYASGSAGIRDETGLNWGVNINMTTQIENHRKTVWRIAGLLGSKKSADEHLNKCLYSVVVGSNDYINNYFMPQVFDTSKKYTPEQFAEVLTQQYSQQLRTLHLLGARKVTLQGLLPIGCTPNATHSYDKQKSLCVDNINDAAYLFNQKLKSVVSQLNHDFSDAKFVFIDIVDIPLTNTAVPGVNVEISSCCDVNINGLCDRGRDSCHPKVLSPFWDGFHPSQAINKIIADITYVAVLPFL